MRASLRPAGGVFGDPTPLPGPPQGANFSGSSAAFDPQGNAVALWSGSDPYAMEPHDVPLLAAGLDAAGPRFEALDIPATGRDDRPLSMSIVPLDVWSPVASTSFAFGDGTGAPGPAAKHRYKAGTYTVEASATDAVGNSSIASQRLKVSDATKPRIRGLRVRPKKFDSAAGRAGASRKAGATIRFRLSERAKVRFVIQRMRHGARGGKRFTRLGAFVRRNRKRGRNHIHFSGRLGHKALPSGSYRLVATAIDRAKHHSRPARARLQVVP
jgi:hypothetical protein